jgi:hypothetical protein
MGSSVGGILSGNIVDNLLSGNIGDKLSESFSTASTKVLTKVADVVNPALDKVVNAVNPTLDKFSQRLKTDGSQNAPDPVVSQPVAPPVSPGNSPAKNPERNPNSATGNGSSGMGGTFLSGGGIDPSTLTLGKKTLLGGGS